jgi:hypothetical protein
MQIDNIKRKRERNRRSPMKKSRKGRETAQEKDGHGEEEYSPLLRRQD